MAAGDEKQDELDKLLGKFESTSAPKPAGEFTRAFFGVEQAKALNPAEPLREQPDQPPAIPSYPRPASTPGEFTRLFGRPSADSQPSALNADEQTKPAMQNVLSPSEPDTSEPGTSTGLFAAPSQVPFRPSSAQPGAFTAFFHSELPAVAPMQSSTDFRPLSLSATSAPSLGADAPPRALPGINAPGAEKSKEDIGAGFAPFPDANPGHNQEKATRLFSLPKPTVDGAPPASGPSAFTRVIASSAQRSAEEKTDSNAAPVNHPMAQGAGAPMIPAPVVAPQWPPSSMPAPVQPAAYLPQQPMPPLMAMPPVAPVAWPQAPPTPVVQMPQPQMQSEEQMPQQKWWITYLPLIIGLNLLFFVAVLLILIFALSR